MVPSTMLLYLLRLEGLLQNQILGPGWMADVGSACVYKTLVELIGA